MIFINIYWNPTGRNASLAPRVDLTQIQMLSRIVLRAHAAARQTGLSDAPLEEAATVLQTARSGDGTRIVYEMLGEGPPLLLVHGSAALRGLWHALGYVDGLVSEHRVILPDLRGHGDSDKPHDERAYAMEHLVEDVLGVLDDAGVERAHYFGYSLGGRVGFALGARAPERLRSMVIGGGSHRPQHGALDRVLYPGFSDTIASDGIDAFLDQLAARFGAPPDPGVRAIFEGADPEALVAYFRAADRDPGVPEIVLRKIELPTLLFAGEHDAERLADSRSAAAAMPHARLEVVPGTNHLSALAATDAVLALVKPFIAGNVRQGQAGA